MGDSVAGLFKRKKRGEVKACESDVEGQGAPVK